jgi:hypothetical protein
MLWKPWKLVAAGNRWPLVITQTSSSTQPRGHREAASDRTPDRTSGLGSIPPANNSIGMGPPAFLGVSPSLTSPTASQKLMHPDPTNTRAQRCAPPELVGAVGQRTAPIARVERPAPILQCPDTAWGGCPRRAITRVIRQGPAATSS